MEPYEVEQIPHGWRVQLPLLGTPEPPAQPVREEASSRTRSKRHRSKQKRAQPRRRKERRQEP